MIRIRRVYDSPQPGEGARFLVDRLWPRGMKKETLGLEAWTKAAAPSDALRRWYGHDPKKWEDFQRRYRAELDASPEAWQVILEAARHGPVTLLYSSRETERNNAVALRDYLLEKLQVRSSRSRGNRR